MQKFIINQPPDYSGRDYKVNILTESDLIFSHQSYNYEGVDAKRIFKKY